MEPRRDPEVEPLVDRGLEALLDWIAEAIKDGAMELILEVTLEATREWAACSRFSACSLIASLCVEGIYLLEIFRAKIIHIFCF